jgi:capsule polysaccharide export protein KpsE/RkpR
LNKEVETTISQSAIEESKGFTLIDLYLVYAKNRKVILLTTLIVCIISIIIYYFIIDKIYLSTATIKSTSKTGGLLSNLEGIPDISGLDDIGIGSGGKSARELATYEEILNSRRCLEEVINKFNLMNREGYEHIEDAVKDFRGTKLALSQEKLAGLLSIGVYDKEPVLAKEMVEFLISQLDKINIELNVQNAKNNREFIEKRYFQAKEDLSKAEDTLKAFQFVYGIAPDLQTKAAAQSVFTIEGELKAEEVKLDVLRKMLSSDQPEVKTQEAKIASLKGKVAEIKNSTDLNDFLRLGNSPQIVMSFLRLQREVEIQSKIITFLLPLYEQAKIEEKRETPTIIVLDKPYVSERKVKPRRLMMVLVLTLLGFFLSNLFFLLRFKFKSWKYILKHGERNY